MNGTVHLMRYWNHAKRTGNQELIVHMGVSLMVKNKVNTTYSVVSYFCGCGGMDLGFRGDFHYHGELYKKLPFKITAAYDNSAPCIETYNQYFGEYAELRDLSTTEAKDVPAADLLIGGFPCQEFSSCGPLGGLESERGQLYKTLIRYMDVHNPKVVVGENVINLMRLENGEVMETIVNDMRNTGYKVKVWVLYAPDYGIPQRRTRLFFICRRNDLSGFPKSPRAEFARTHRSIEWAIGDLVDVNDGSVPNQDQYFGASRAKKGNGQGDENNRRLTVRECARIQTFPDDFVFIHAATTSISQIGNAVPPVLSYCVASSIADYLGTLEEEV